MQVNMKAMITIGQGRLTHLVSRIKKVCIWHRRFEHPSNVKVIWVLKLLTEMGDFGKNYEVTEIYSDSEASEPEKSFDNPNPINNDSTDADTTIETQHKRLMKASKITDSDFDEICEPYVGSKQTRVVHRYKPMTPVEEKLEEVHVDLWGPHNPASLSSSMYVAILKCEKTRKLWVLYLRLKDKFVDAFQNWLSKIEIESGQLIKTFYADRGGEFISIKLKGFCNKKSIALKYPVPYMHEENGLAERSWRTIITINDLLLWDSELPLDFWAEAIDTANYLQNRLPTKSQRGKLIPEEAWSNKKQDVSYLKVFKSLASMEIPKEKRYKFDI